MVDHAVEYRKLEESAGKARIELAEELRNALGYNDDVLRSAIGSFALRKLYEIDSLERQMDAHIEEWINQ